MLVFTINFAGLKIEIECQQSVNIILNYSPAVAETLETLNKNEFFKMDFITLTRAECRKRL
jgi:anti-anti-sigma regulatory factor